MSLNRIRPTVTALAVFDSKTLQLNGVVRFALVEKNHHPLIVRKHEDGAVANTDTLSNGFDLLFCWQTAAELAQPFPALKIWKSTLPAFLNTLAQSFDGAPESIFEHMAILQSHKTSLLVLLPCEPWEKPLASLERHLAKSLVRRELLAENVLEFLDDLRSQTSDRQRFKRVG